MAYYTQQIAQLPDSGLYAIKIEARGGDSVAGETRWMNITPGQLARIGLILAERDDYYVITPADVGKATLHAFGRTWPVVDFMGRILPRDVGKRVTMRRDNADVSSFPQVENDEQLRARLGAPTVDEES